MSKLRPVLTSIYNSLVYANHDPFCSFWLEEDFNEKEMNQEEENQEEANQEKIMHLATN